MSKMFCFQCQQTAKNQGCSIQGVCGKGADTANRQDRLIGHAAALGAAVAGKDDLETERLIADCLFATVTNVNFDDPAIDAYTARIDAMREKYPETPPMDMAALWSADEDLRSLKSLVLFGLKGVAAYAHHAAALDRESGEVYRFFPRALADLRDETDAGKLLDLALEVGQVNFKCMELLDRAHTKTYGTPAPTKVQMKIEPGPFIVVSGHDLRDLELVLRQTEGRGVSVYTHGEMLPAHAYPKLKAYAHLRGNFGTAWQNQQTEFENLPAPVLFTTNCVMPVRDSYRDRVFTTSVVGYPGMTHIGPDKNFTPVIEKALELGGFKEAREMTGINGGGVLTVGFGHGAILSVAGKVIGAVKSGAIRRFFLVGGCDGAAPGRGYYTDFVKRTPKDTVVLTLACGKYRFNDLDLGEIAGLPRLMDMGQCNDAYGAIKVALALAEAFGCGVNDLPLTLVLSWYEQKAVCILLTLLALGVKNIYLGPTLPAFVSPNILKAIVERWNIIPTSTPEEDLKKILG